MKKIENLTEGQKSLFLPLHRAILNKENVEDILKQHKLKNEGSYDTDIEAVFTAFMDELDDQGHVNESYTLSALAVKLAVKYDNVEALEHILKAAKKTTDLEKKILTEVQHEDFRSIPKKGCSLLEYARSETKWKISSLNSASKLNFSPHNTYYEQLREEAGRVTKIVSIIEEEMRTLKISISQDPATGSNHLFGIHKSPSFLSQHKGKVAIIGVVALAGTIAAFMSGHPIIGIIVALAATFMLATEEGREVCDRVGSKISGMFSQSAKPQELLADFN